MTVLIAATSRTPFTRVGGALAGWHPVDLAAAVMNETLDRAGIDAGAVDEVWLGCAEPVGAQGADMARAALLCAEWPEHVGGTVVDRGETSGSAALHAAVASIRARMCRVAMVVGVSAASIVPPGASALGRVYGRPWGEGPALRVEPDGGLLPPPAAADRAAGRLGISRRAQDTWAGESHRRRAAGERSAIVPLAARPGDGVPIQRGTPVSEDDGRELPTDPAALPPGFDPEGSVTGFTFAPPVDGAAAILLVALDPERDGRPGSSEGDGRARIVGCGRGAGHPLDPVGGVERAVAAALADAGGAAGAVSTWELAEPTAAATLVAIRCLGLDPDVVNPAGGTLGVGDAGAAEELRLLTDAVNGPGEGPLVATVAFGPVGSAATIIRRP